MVSDKDCTGLECGVQLGSSFYDVCTVGDCVNLQYCRSVPLQTREKGSKSKKIANIINESPLSAIDALEEIFERPCQSG